jgi:rRNA maturation RNase YbeY
VDGASAALDQDLPAVGTNLLLQVQQKVAAAALDRDLPAVGTASSNMNQLLFHNRQRVRNVDLRYLRQLCRELLRSMPDLRHCELGVHLVAASEIIRINVQFLRHPGSTDVITFDHREAPATCLVSPKPDGVPTPPSADLRFSDLYGEIFICVDEAVANARRFRTSWQQELARYLAHGILHLRGWSDRYPAQRRRMKKAEDRIMRQWQRRFPLRRLARPGKMRA